MAVPKTMKAVGLYKPGKEEDVLKLVEVPVPTPKGQELLVRVLSIATNPIDVKARKMLQVAADADEKKLPLRIVGWDAVGTVVARGAEAKSDFKVGEKVWFAGALFHDGCQAEYVTVDERIVSRPPSNLSNDDAATVPLCALTVIEAFTEQMNVKVPTNAAEEKLNGSKSALVIAGAGGVGSFATQYLKHVLKFGRVIATASRKDTEEWCKKNGADATINHKNPLAPQLKALGLEHGVDYVLNAAEIDGNFSEMVSAVAPFGYAAVITAAEKPIPAAAMNALFYKRAKLVWELMFARTMTGIELEKQGAILASIVPLYEKGVLKSTLTKRFDFSLSDVLAASKLQDSGAVIGKLALTVAK